MMKQKNKTKRKSLSDKRSNFANVGHIWLDVLVPFTHEYNIKLTASEVSAKVFVPRRTVARTLAMLAQKHDNIERNIL